MSCSKNKFGIPVVSANTSGSANLLGKSKDLLGRGDSSFLVGSSMKLKTKLKKDENQHRNGGKITTKDCQQLASETQPSKRRKLLEDISPDAEQHDSILVHPKEERSKNPSSSLLGKPEYEDEIPETNVVLSPRRKLAADIENLDLVLVKNDNIENKVAEFMRLRDNVYQDLARKKGIPCTQNSPAK